MNPGVDTLAVALVEVGRAQRLEHRGHHLLEPGLHFLLLVYLLVDVLESEPSRRRIADSALNELRENKTAVSGSRIVHAHGAAVSNGTHPQNIEIEWGNVVDDILGNVVMVNPVKT